MAEVLPYTQNPRTSSKFSQTRISEIYNMLNMNFTGRLGKTAETRSTPNDDKVTSFPVAVDVGWGDKKRTQWIECAFWGDRGEKVAPYLNKGQLVAITGSPSVRAYTPQGGEARAQLQCSVRDLDLLGSKSDGGSGGSEATSGQYRNQSGGGGSAPQDEFTEDGDLIPFITSAGMW